MILFSTILIFSIQLQANGLVKIHAPHNESFTCTEHWDGQFQSIGDALGTDCVIQKMVTLEERSFMRTFESNGLKNSDWFGYNKDVLAPCNCTVEKIHVNPAINEPGIMKPGVPGYITFKKSDGTRIDIAHVSTVKVSEGDEVKSGQVVAKVGNNGYSRNPHVHISAWKDNKPLQIQFNQKTLALLERGLVK